MIRRAGLLVFSGLAAVLAVGIYLWLGAQASCACIPRPTAAVNGIRYEVSFQSVELENVEGHATARGPVVSDYDEFAERTAYALDGVDPALYLIVPSAANPSAAGEYRELWRIPKREFPTGLCQYFPEERASSFPVCQAQ